MNQGFLKRRRARLRELLAGRTILLFSGLLQFRNITAGSLPFRATSHCLYFFGKLPPSAVALIGPDRETIFWPFPSEESIVWEGPAPELSELQFTFQCDDIRPLAELDSELRSLDLNSLGALPLLQRESNDALKVMLGREVSLEGIDRDCALAVIACRLFHDEEALSELRKAAKVNTEAFSQALRTVQVGQNGLEILATMLSCCLRQGMGTSFEPTITTSGEILHCQTIAGNLQTGELLLVDFGAETPAGYAADVTRTWPVSGKFSPEQKEIYELVLAMQEAAFSAISPERRYWDVHEAACRSMIEGLKAMGLFCGDTDSLFERGAHTLFFPHGIGHLIGLDVHDLEDLGDLAGYEVGCTRDLRFGFRSLRLNRKLQKNMLVSVEPGFYQISAILSDPARRRAYGDCVLFDKLDRFQSVRGIRIEDEVLIKDDGYEILTADIPKSVKAIEAELQSREG